MMPLLQTFGNMSLKPFGFGGALKDDFELIQTSVLGSNTPSVTFTLTSLHQSSYKHLQLRAIARTTDNQAYADLYLRFNGDTATNYGWHYVSGTGSGSPSSGWASSQTGIFVGRASGNTATTNNFSAATTDIIDAFSSNKNKVTRMIGGEIDSSYMQTLTTSGLWSNTAAVTSITLFSNQGGNLVAGTRLSLYGIRG
jgi:hypothetical protein